MRIFNAITTSLQVHQQIICYEASYRSHNCNLYTNYHTKERKLDSFQSTNHMRLDMLPREIITIIITALRGFWKLSLRWVRFVLSTAMQMYYRCQTSVVQQVVLHRTPWSIRRLSFGLKVQVQLYIFQSCCMPPSLQLYQSLIAFPSYRNHG